MQFKWKFNNTSYFLEAVSVRHIVIDTGPRSSGRKVKVRAGMVKNTKRKRPRVVVTVTQI